MRSLRRLVIASAVAGGLLATIPARAEPPPSSTKMVPLRLTTEAIAAHPAKLQTMFGVLGLWGLGSVGVGAGLTAGGPDDFSRFAGVPVLAWGALDLGLSIYGQLRAKDDLFRGDGAEARVVADRASSSRAFWIGALLDLGAVIAGALIWNLGTTDGVRGVGAGLATQGTFHFAFDSAGFMLFR